MHLKYNCTTIVVCIALLSTKLFSQSTSEVCNTNRCCCGNDPTPAGVMISHIHKKKEWMFAYRYMSMNMNGILSGTRNISNNDVLVNYLMSSDKMQMDMHMLMAMYGLTDKLTLMAMLNYNVQTMHMNMIDQSMMNMPGMPPGTVMPNTMKSSGISDAKLYALYSLVNKENHQFLLSAGANIPLGSVVLRDNTGIVYPNQHLPYSMQLGSGTIDVMPGITYLYQPSKVMMSTQLMSVIRFGYNQSGYKLGNEIGLNSWISYQWLRFFSTSLRVEATANGKISGYDKQVYYYNEPSSNPNNYGGQKVNGYAGAVFQLKRYGYKNNRLGIEYGIPMYQRLNGIQTKQVSTINAFWSFAF